LPVVVKDGRAVQVPALPDQLFYAIQMLFPHVLPAPAGLGVLAVKSCNYELHGYTSGDLVRLYSMPQFN